jgi:hypothetical protein
MGRQLAESISEFDIPLLNQIELHLTTNFYPPVPRFMAQTCVDALNAYWEEDIDRMIDMPNGVKYKGSTSAPAWAIVEQHRLSAWLNEEEDYDND